MNRVRLVALVLHAAGFAVCSVGLFTHGSALVAAGGMAANAVMFVVHVIRLKKEKSHGRDRRAQASASDPEADYRSAAARAADRADTSGTEDDPTAGLEVVTDDLPILAHRMAGIAFDGSGLPFLSLNGSLWGQFGVDADAICTARMYDWTGLRCGTPGHSAPHGACTCGFYAVPVDVERWIHRPHLVTLMVELSGMVIEHEDGYRAEHQRVIECQISPCQFCGRKATVVHAGESNVMVGAYCEAHARQRVADITVPACDLQVLLGVPVTFLGGES